MPLFSIIVACYNVEKYIKRCVESIENQTFADYELILVNDGSTDQTEQVINKLSHDYHFRYLKKENGGLGSVRNYGMKYANGKYVIQFDGDDFVKRNWLSKVANIALEEKPDMIFWGGRAVNELGAPINNGVRQSYVEGFISPCKFLYYLAEDKAKNWSWSFALKKEIINVKDLPIYPEGISYEDLASTYKLVKKAKTIYLISGYFYNYTQHQGTITKSPNLKQYNDLELIKQNVEEEFNNDSELKKLWVYQISIMEYQIISRLDNKRRKKLLQSCANSIITHKSKHLTHMQLIKYYFVKFQIYSFLYRILYKYRNK